MPETRGPLTVTPVSSCSKTSPRSSHIVLYIPIGRLIKPSAPFRTVSLPERRQIGTKNRRVLPLSLHPSAPDGSAQSISVPVTVIVSPSRWHFTPRASRQSMVASTSFDSAMPCTTDTPSASPAHMSSLCAMLFDGGACTEPLAVPFEILTFIYFSPIVSCK